MQRLSRSTTQDGSMSKPPVPTQRSPGAECAANLTSHRDTSRSSTVPVKRVQQQTLTQQTPPRKQCLKRRNGGGKMDGGGIQEVRGGTPGADDGEEPKLRSACDNCSVKKIKCDGVMPCHACRKRFLTCHFSVKRPTGPKRHAPSSCSSPLCLSSSTTSSSSSSSSLTTGSWSGASTNRADCSSASSPPSTDPLTPRGTGPNRSREFAGSPRSSGGKRLRRLVQGAEDAGTGEGKVVTRPCVTYREGGSDAGGVDPYGGATCKAVPVPSRGGVGTRQSSERRARGSKIRTAVEAVSDAPVIDMDDLEASSPIEGRVQAMGGTGNENSKAESSCPSEQLSAGAGIMDSNGHGLGGESSGTPLEWSGWRPEGDEAEGVSSDDSAEVHGREPNRARVDVRPTGRISSSGSRGPGISMGRSSGRGPEKKPGPALPITGSKSSRTGGKRVVEKQGSGEGGWAKTSGRKAADGAVGGRERAGSGAGTRRVGREGAGGARSGVADLRSKMGRARCPGGEAGTTTSPIEKAPPPALPICYSTQALDQSEKDSLHVFLSTVNEFIPFMSQEIVDAMRNGVPSTPTTVEKEENLGPLLVHGIEPERVARSALVNAALMVGSLIKRDRPSAVTFAHRARQCLKEIFDFPSVEAASALLCLAYYSHNTGDKRGADLYLVNSHAFCLYLSEFPLNLEVCIEHMTHGRLQVELREDFRSWDNHRYQVLHVANHVLSTLTWQGERGLLAALQKNDPSLFDGGEAALLRCVHELVWCMRISDNNALTRLICSSLVGLLLMLMGRRHESLRVAESVVEGVSAIPAIVRVMPLSWTATLISSGLLFVYEHDGLYRHLYALVAPLQKRPDCEECLPPAPGSDVENYLQHRCSPSSFCHIVAIIARLTDRGRRSFCPAPPVSQDQELPLGEAQPHVMRSVRESEGGASASVLPDACSGNRGAGGLGDPGETTANLEVSAGGSRVQFLGGNPGALGAVDGGDSDKCLARLLASSSPLMQRSSMFGASSCGSAKPSPKMSGKGRSCNGDMDDVMASEAQGHFEGQAPSLGFGEEAGPHHPLGFMPQRQRSQRQQLHPQPQAQVSRELMAAGGGSGLTVRGVESFVDISPDRAQEHLATHGRPSLPVDETGQDMRRIQPLQGTAAGTGTAAGEDPIMLHQHQHHHHHHHHHQQQQHRQLVQHQQVVHSQGQRMQIEHGELRTLQDRRFIPPAKGNFSPLNAPAPSGVPAAIPLHTGSSDIQLRLSTPPAIEFLQAPDQQRENSAVRDPSECLVTVPAHDHRVFEYGRELLGTQATDPEDPSGFIGLMSA